MKNQVGSSSLSNITFTRAKRRLHSILLVATFVGLSSFFFSYQTLLLKPVREFNDGKGSGAAAHFPRNCGRILAAQLVGGLGNQFFIAAAAIAYAVENNASVLLCKPPESDRRAVSTAQLRHTAFELVPTAEYTADEILAAATSLGIPSSVIQQQGSFASFNALPKMDELQVRTTCKSVVKMNGYFQHSLYFEHSASIVRSLLGPSMDESKRLLVLYPYLQNAVAIHIRRGDYVTDASILLGMKYYENALRLLLQSVKGKENPHVIVISDDLRWVWAQPFFASLQKAGGASEIDEPDALRALWILSLVRQGLVCPNSTFCWWAAWLGNFGKQSSRPVVLPARWASGLPPMNELGFYPSWAIVYNDSRI